MQELLAPFGIEAVSAGALGLPVPEETGHMFAENAGIKAHAAARPRGCRRSRTIQAYVSRRWTGRRASLPPIGPGPNRDYPGAMARVDRELRTRGATTPEERRAHFVSALVVAWPDGHGELFEGRVFGHVVWPPRGAQGFGYDPLFQPDGHSRTFGEMSAEEKHGIDWSSAEPKALSHRARAFAKLAQGCLKRM
jgi:XTP/dITP diphosphohydrolase